jgi:hypothetical protein
LQGNQTKRKKARFVQNGILKNNDASIKAAAAAEKVKSLKQKCCAFALI